MIKTYDVKLLEPVIEFLDSLEEQERDKKVKRGFPGNKLWAK